MQTSSSTTTAQTIGNQTRSSYDDCQLLQLTDLLVSGFRTALADSTHDAQWQICRPLSALVEKWNRGRKGFSNSRWFKGFCIREGRLDEIGQWQFANIELDIGSTQSALFNGST